MKKIAAPTIETEIKEVVLPNSVVPNGYKAKYAERGLSLSRKPKGVVIKVLKRGCNDWLHHELAKICNDTKGALNLPLFESILEANGIHAHRGWNRTTKGWQGRVRMSGSMLLRRTIAEAEGEMVLPDGATVKAPRSWVEKQLH